MKNPFKRSDNNDERTPEGEPLEHVGSGSVLGSKKLVLVAAIATFAVIILDINQRIIDEIDKLKLMKLSLDY